MGFHAIPSPSSSREVHHHIALGLIRKSLGNWQPRQFRWQPEVRVEMISNLSRMYLPQARSWWRRWVRRLGLF